MEQQIKNKSNTSTITPYRRIRAGTSGHWRKQRRPLQRCNEQAAASLERLLQTRDTSTRLCSPSVPLTRFSLPQSQSISGIGSLGKLQARARSKNTICIPLHPQPFCSNLGVANCALLPWLRSVVPRRRRRRGRTPHLRSIWVDPEAPPLPSLMEFVVPLPRCESPGCRCEQALELTCPDGSKRDVARELAHMQFAMLHMAPKAAENMEKAVNVEACMMPAEIGWGQPVGSLSARSRRVRSRGTLSRTASICRTGRSACACGAV